MRVFDDLNGRKETQMKRYRPEEIVGKLRQADVELGKGRTVKEVCRLIEVTEQTYYRWRQKYGGMSPELIKELRALQRENQRLRKIIADQRIDMEILKEAQALFSKNR
jgi:transposase-like protein